MCRPFSPTAAPCENERKSVVVFLSSSLQFISSPPPTRLPPAPGPNMIPWIATFWLASIVVSAGYTPTLDVTETLMYNHPAFEYGPSWSMVFPESLGPVNGVHVPAGNGPAVYQSNSTSSASFSLPFYGAGVKNLALAVSPWDTTVASASVTLSLDSTTWTVSMKTTPSASLQGPTAVFPLAIDVGPQGLTSTSTQRVLKVSVDGNILASFLSVDIVSGFQTNA